MATQPKQTELFDEGPREIINFRAPRSLWHAFKARTDAQGVPASLVLRQMIKEYIEENQQLELVSGDKRK